ncbi:MAG TPA: methyltransferase domain-containing protein [Vicinamibacterales bacterium]
MQPEAADRPSLQSASCAPELLAILRCPSCQGVFRDHRSTLECAECGKTFPVVRGIPRFVPADNYANNFGFQWNHFRSTQLDSHSGQPISADRFARETRWPGDALRGKLVLDAGCGAGRFAEVALNAGATVVAIDYSNAVEACRNNLPHPSLHVVQADIYALPFAPESFDFVYSLGVIQHTPDVERAVKALVAPLKPGGELVVDVYAQHWKGWLHPRVWLRPITTRMDSERLFRLVRRFAPALLRVSDVVGTVPVVGPHLRRLVPVANYRGQLPLTPLQLREWAILDTFDWLAPRYDQPQTLSTLRRWLTEGGLVDLQVFRADHLTARGRKPAAG